ncbi:hypothetical protein GB937_007617 [Aspergillus fischeri]|nr:hypothetical protein GB937_007617 [Aspergillus fischeri]
MSAGWLTGALNYPANRQQPLPGVQAPAPISLDTAPVSANLSESANVAFQCFSFFGGRFN